MDRDIPSYHDPIMHTMYQNGLKTGVENTEQPGSEPLGEVGQNSDPSKDTLQQEANLTKTRSLSDTAHTISLAHKTIEQGGSVVFQVPLPDLMMAIMVERANLLQLQLRDAVSTIQGKNRTLETANEMIGLARAKKQEAKSDDKSVAIPEELLNFAKENDVELGKSGSLKNEEWDLVVENLKGWSESLTSTSQLEMTKLQSVSGKFNQSFEMLSQFISKYFRGGDSIIKNI